MALKLPEGPARVRIAPSPTGDPHVGTAYVALFNLALARRTGGAFVLRIEDTDRKRFDADSERQILESLRWLGLGHDEGPERGGPHGPYRQSERSELYRSAVEGLIASGRAYRCFCTPERLAAMREEQRRTKQNLGYDGVCRQLAPEEAKAKLKQGLPHVVRLAVPRPGRTRFTDGLRGEVDFDNAMIDDQVLLKSDGLPTYHLANVVDDHAMGITHVLRGEEWISSTPKHVLLYEAFGWDLPAFVHLPLLRKADKNKSKLSKRKDPVSVLWYREQGYPPEALVNFLGLMGFSMPDEREVFSLEEFIRAFDTARLRTTGPAFDLQKLEWLSGEWIRSFAAADLLARIDAFYGGAYAERMELARRVLPLVQPRLKTLADWKPKTDLFFEDLPEYDAALLTPKKVDGDKARAVLAGAREALADVEPFAAGAMDAICRGVAGALELKPSPLFMVLRVAVTGSQVSPPLFESMEVLGRAETLRRLDLALRKLGEA